ncbi:MAG: flagellin [Ruminococcaceae bacterium]|nr:flagellin [Oscillospiraceae bacterium]
MVVRSNIMALNANRQLGMNNTQVSKSLEKLSSGFKINRAGDDASGLAISEKMKAQIKGLETASANSQDGISLVQTAEGALTEVHSMLNRMVELATKSANGTLQDDVDRDAIQSEVDALLKEIDRIGDSTNFNGINLLDGSLTAATTKAIAGEAGVDAATPGTAGSVEITITDKVAAGNTIKIGDKTYEFVKDAGDVKSGNVAVVMGADADANATALATAITGDAPTGIATATASDAVVTVTNAIADTTDNVVTADEALAPTVTVEGGLALQIGDSSDSFNKMSVSVEDMRSAGLGISSLDVSTADAAADSIKTIKDAINKVSTNRANMGALQNRLEYTINNLDVSAENLTSANSRIRDTDMAKEMMNYTKMNVLTQAAQAMLAQANQQPQSILQLLQ